MGVIVTLHSSDKKYLNHATLWPNFVHLMCNEK